MTNKEKILGSALKLFAKQGIDKTSTTQIATEVGLSSGAPFAHFKTKQELVDTIYLEIKRDIYASLSKSLSDSESAENNIKVMLRGMVAHFLSNYDAFVFMTMIEVDPQVSEKALDAWQKEFSGAREMMKTWIKKEEIKNIEADLIPIFLWSNSLMLIKYCHAKKLKKASDVMLDLVWEGIKK